MVQRWGICCQCRRHRFDPWSRKTPHPTKQLSLCAPASNLRSRAWEPKLSSPCATTTEAHGSWSPRSATREATAVGRLSTAAERGPRSPQPEEACAARAPAQPNQIQANVFTRESQAIIQVLSGGNLNPHKDKKRGTWKGKYRSKLCECSLLTL